MKKILIIVGVLGACVVGFVVLKKMQAPTVTAVYTIGILQTASHPALDASRDGFMEELKSKLGDDVAFVVQNAEGSISNVHTIAQQFHAKQQFKAFFAIATPAAQALHAIEKERPIIIAAVSDPVSVGLVDSKTNVSGTKDMIDVKAGIDLLTQLIPTAKTVGILYTSGETNSVVLVEQMHKELKACGLTATDFAMSSEADMQAMVESAANKVDVLLAPTDNMIGSAIASIATIALKHKKPLIVSDNMLVKDGALAAHGVDYRAGGKRSAQIAYDILVGGKKPEELPIEQVGDGEIFINQNTLASLGLSIPESLKEKVVIVS
jgi:putative ABC transport system substrate-binding protein